MSSSVEQEIAPVAKAALHVKNVRRVVPELPVISLLLLIRLYCYFAALAEMEK
jgi:hypothetical protein